MDMVIKYLEIEVLLEKVIDFEIFVFFIMDMGVVRFVEK